LHPGQELQAIPVPAREVSLADAVRSYLFNSQLVTLGPDQMAMIVPTECREIPSVENFLEKLVAGEKSPIRQLHHVDLRQSMRNGGGPACLRLRVVLTPEEAAAMLPRIRVDDRLHETLVRWVQRHYRDQLHPDDLADA